MRRVFSLRGQGIRAQRDRGSHVPFAKWTQSVIGYTINAKVPRPAFHLHIFPVGKVPGAAWQSRDPAAAEPPLAAWSSEDKGRRDNDGVNACMYNYRVPMCDCVTIFEMGY